MLKLVAELSSQYQPRHYVVAATDAMSTEKLHSMEKTRALSKGDSLVRATLLFVLHTHIQWLKAFRNILLWC